MRNITLKKRYNEPVKCRKNNLIQQVQGKYVLEIKRDCPHNLGEHIKNKPKEFSFRTWVFPVLYNMDVETAEKHYQECKEWYNMDSQKVIVEISGKLQHLAMCFDSPHFTSCGMDLRYNKASDKILQSNVFCIFTRDRRGLINNRMILKIGKNILTHYSYYGNDNFRETFLMLLAEKFKNLELCPGGSFL